MVKHFHRSIALALILFCTIEYIAAQPISLRYKGIDFAHELTSVENLHVVTLNDSVRPESFTSALTLMGISIRTGRVAAREAVVLEMNNSDVSALEQELSAHISAIGNVYRDQFDNLRVPDPQLMTVAFDAIHTEDEISAILTEMGSSIVLDFWTPGLYGVLIPHGIGLFDAVELFQQRSEVTNVSPAFYSQSILASDTYLADSWHLNNTGQQTGYVVGNDIDADGAWNITIGSSDVIIAIIDTGVEMTHPDLDDDLLIRGTSEDWNFASTTSSSPDPQGNPHGTGVAGIAAAEMNSIGVRGVAPHSKILPLKIDPNSEPYTLDAYKADAINYASNYANAAGKEMVINCSWKIDGCDANVSSSIQSAVNSGIPVVFSSGNDNTDVAYPASDANSIAVGMMPPCAEVRKSPTSCDGFTGGSNYGPTLAIAAPGVLIHTTDLLGGNSGKNTDSTACPSWDSECTGDLSDTDYTKMWIGTSFAAPIVSGVAALVLAIDPTLSVSQIRDILFVTAEKVGGYTYTNGHSNELGHGRVNAYEAVRRAAELSTVFLYGDVNEDGSVTSTPDADLVLEHSAEVITLTGKPWVAGEVSRNDAIGSYDASLIMQYENGSISCFPADNQCTAKTGTSGAIASADLKWETPVFENGAHIIPVRLASHTGDIFSLDFAIAIPNRLAQVSDVYHSLPQGWKLAYNQKDDTLRVAMAGGSPLQPGQLLTIRIVSEGAGAFELSGHVSVHEDESLELDRLQFDSNGMASIQSDNSFGFRSAYPNPFNPSTILRYSLSEAAMVELSVYDVLGREVAVLVRSRQTTGQKAVTFNANGLSSGLYIVKLSIQSDSGEFLTQTRRILLTK